MRIVFMFIFAIVLAAVEVSAEERYADPIDMRVPPIASDPSIVYDYDIVYVRAQRAGDRTHRRFYTDFSQPVTLEPGADLMLLHPDGREERLVAGVLGSVTDPAVSFDGQWVYYTLVQEIGNFNQWVPPKKGADIYKIHIPTRRIVRLTNQKFTPNTGAAAWSSDFRTAEEGKTHYEYGVFNMGPCPLPGRRVAFTSNRDGFRPPRGYPAVALQLFVMDDRDTDIGEREDPSNLEKIGHLNLAGALHPVVLTDGRIMFSTLESQGIRNPILWGIWTIHPDGTAWAPLVSAFDPGNGFHFQAQLGDGGLVIEEYYNQNNSGFGAYIKVPPVPPTGYVPFGPAFSVDPRNRPWRYGRLDDGRPDLYRIPFMPTGSVSLTPFTHGREGPAGVSVLADPNAPRVGKFTHPAPAPDNHLLTVYSTGPVNHQFGYLPQLDGGIYLIKGGAAVEEPARMRLIKNDPAYNESWPRALVPYRRIYGIDEPSQLPRLRNDGAYPGISPKEAPSAWSARRASTSARAIRKAWSRRTRLRPDLPAATTPGRGSTRSPATATGCPGTGTSREPTRVFMKIARSMRYGSCRWSRRPTGTEAPASADGFTVTPANGSAFLARSRSASSERTRRLRKSTPTATPTPVFWPRSRPILRSPSKRSIAGAWS